jgi:hypothetical protein
MEPNGEFVLGDTERFGQFLARFTENVGAPDNICIFGLQGWQELLKLHK